MFYRNSLHYTESEFLGRPCIIVDGLGEYDLTDTMECGQCFRHLRVAGGEGRVYTDSKDAPISDASSSRELPEGYCEYFTVAGELAVRVGQRKRGELIFFGLSGEDIPAVEEFFSLKLDFDAIREFVKQNTDSAVLKEYADIASGVAILTQDTWETLFSFIVSQNNNIPRIRKIIRRICADYGENLALREGFAACPISGLAPCAETCRECGRCYTFPRPDDVLANPDALDGAKPGFRKRYLLSASELVKSGELKLDEIKSRGELEYTLSQLKRIVGVGDKVASCCALFAFGNYDAFPIDVWIKRAIDERFDGNLDLSGFLPYAGIAQQYIFHSIRNLENSQDK